MNSRNPDWRVPADQRGMQEPKINVYIFNFPLDPTTVAK